jgi:hypothetical protein
MMIIDIMKVQKGDIVRFKSYALHVESEPVRTASSIRLEGRKSTDGCPTVSKWFLKNLLVEVER